jgi:hypothetical protein
MPPSTIRQPRGLLCPQRVFVLAPPVGEAQKTMERNAFNAAVEAGVKRIVYLSSYGAAFGDSYPYIGPSRE